MKKKWNGGVRIRLKAKRRQHNQMSVMSFNIKCCIALPSFCYNFSWFFFSVCVFVKAIEKFAEYKERRNGKKTHTHTKKWKSHKVVNHSSFCMVNFWLFNLLTSHGDHAFCESLNIYRINARANVRFSAFACKWKALGQCGIFMHFDAVAALIYAHFQRILCAYFAQTQKPD